MLVANSYWVAMNCCVKSHQQKFLTANVMFLHAENSETLSEDGTVMLVGRALSHGCLHPTGSLIAAFKYGYLPAARSVLRINGHCPLKRIL